MLSVQVLVKEVLAQKRSEWGYRVVAPVAVRQHARDSGQLIHHGRLGHRVRLSRLIGEILGHVSTLLNRLIISDRLH